MKLLLFTKKLGVLLLFISPLFTFAQIEAPLIGTYTVIEGSPIETFIISSDRVDATVDSQVVERFFFYEKEDETYILEKVKPEVTAIDLSVVKDRKLVKVNLTYLDSGEIQLNIDFPNGKEQELTMKKVE